MSAEIARADGILPRAEMIDPTKALVIVQHNGKVYTYEGVTTEVTFEKEYTSTASLRERLIVEFVGVVIERVVTL